MKRKSKKVKLKVEAWEEMEIEDDEKSSGKLKVHEIRIMCLISKY